MFRCNECTAEFDNPMTIEEPRGEAWGRPVTEEMHVCPFCKSSDYEVKDQVRRIERLMDDGTWEDVLFEDLEKGDICRMYEPDTDEPVVSDAGLTLMRVTSNLVVGKAIGNGITEPMITIDWLKEIPAKPIEDSSSVPNLSRVHSIALFDENGNRIYTLDTRTKDNLTLVLSVAAIGCDELHTIAKGLPDQLLHCAISVIESVGEGTQTKASNLASQIAYNLLAKEIAKKEKANGKQ